MVLLVRAPPRPKGDSPDATMLSPLNVTGTFENSIYNDLGSQLTSGALPRASSFPHPCQVVVGDSRIADDRQVICSLPGTRYCH